ncbi:hypothetical protein chiPu_0006775 [Chiloscyllium punctatum]|uniref:Uncharacterized protein n=1 Tax=Chiloscyllium punctatum TaxID=137246 RepID=A0A401SD76_CHIPU|nr:hypothetical protein [Chiloscyllium punctatum]
MEVAERVVAVVTEAMKRVEWVMSKEAEVAAVVVAKGAEVVGSMVWLMSQGAEVVAAAATGGVEVYSRLGLALVLAVADLVVSAAAVGCPAISAAVVWLA